MAGRISAARRMRIYVVILLCGIFLGCASTRPGWVDQVQERSGVEVFVAEGNGTNAFNARLDALHAVLSQLSDALGVDVTSTAWREFSTTGKVEAYGLAITREERDGSRVWVEAEAESRQLEIRRSAARNERIQHEQRIRNLLEDVEEAYRNNEDGKAIEALLDALTICAAHPTSYRAEDLVPLAVTYLSSLRYTLSRRNEGEPSALVRVKRSQVLFSPRVKNAEVQARFPAHDLWRNEGEDSLVFDSGVHGQFVFKPLSMAMDPSGTITFRLAIDDRMEALGRVLDPSLYQQLEAAWNSHAATFPYRRVSRYAGSPVRFAMQWQDGRGGLKDASSVGTFLIDALDAWGVALDPVAVAEPSTGEDLAQTYAGGKGFLLSMVLRDEGLVDVGETTLYHLSGSLELWDLATQTVVSRSGVMEGYWESEEAAAEELSYLVADRFSEYL